MIKHCVIDNSESKHECHAVVLASNGKEYTMYGEIVNGRVITSATNPSFWNSKDFRSLPEDEQIQLKEEVNIALSNLYLNDL